MTKDLRAYLIETQDTLGTRLSDLKDKLGCNLVRLTLLLDGTRMLSPDELVRLSTSLNISPENLVNQQHQWLKYKVAKMVTASSVKKIPFSEYLMTRDDEE